MSGQLISTTRLLHNRPQPAPDLVLGVRDMADSKGQMMPQQRNDLARHEAFVELHNLSCTTTEDFVVPEIVLVGTSARLWLFIAIFVFSVPVLIAVFMRRWRPAHPQ